MASKKPAKSTPKTPSKKTKSVVAPVKSPSTKAGVTTTKTSSISPSKAVSLAKVQELFKDNYQE